MLGLSRLFMGNYKDAERELKLPLNKTQLLHFSTLDYYMDLRVKTEETKQT